MFKTLLIPQFGQDGDQKALELASEILIDEGGHLNCLYVHDDAAAIASCMQTDAMGVPVATPQLIDALNEEARDQKRRAKQTFDQFCAKNQVSVQVLPCAPAILSASWQELSADVVQSIAQAARYNDATVLRRGPKFADPSFTSIGSIAIGAGRPLLVYPEFSRRGPVRNIAVAWKDTPEAARAVNLALPILRQARQVSIFSASEDDKLEDAKKSADACARFLRWHNVDAEVRCMESDEADAKSMVFAEAAGVGADLIVMGAYGHSRMRELVFGGFTRRAISESSVPLMLVH